MIQRAKLHHDRRRARPPGNVAGLDNGNPVGHEAYKGTARSAFSGKALAIVRSTTSPGKVTLKITSASLTGASATIIIVIP